MTKEKFTDTLILNQVTSTPQTTRQITDQIQYIDKNGHVWKPAAQTVASKLNKLFDDGKIDFCYNRSDVIMWFRPVRRSLRKVD